MELSRLALGLILISVLSFARAQVDCLPFNVSELGPTDVLTRGGLIGAALEAVSGNPFPVSVQVHDSNIVCLRSGRTRDTYRGVSVVVSYTCTGGSRSECTGNPILSQFDFECVTGPTWTTSVGGSASNIITTPPSGTLSTTLRTDCGVCISPARSGFAAVTNNEQHCGSCDPACNTTQPSFMRCFNRLNSGCCNFFVDNMCVAGCPSPLVPNSRFDCVVNCSSVPDLKNGMVIYNPQGQDRTLVGATVTYTCDTGYTLSGSRMRTCQASGNWTGSDPNCNIVDCASLSDPLNGAVDISQGTTYNAMATYSCNSPYTLNGDMARTCQADGTWSGSAPGCVIICDPPCMNGRCENGRCTNCPEGRFGVNCTGRCSGMDPACQVCVNGTARFECVRCEDGSSLDSQTNMCQRTGIATFMNDVATIAAITIAVISLLTSVATVAIMVCFVIFFLKRSSRDTARQNQQYMEMQQNVAYTTKAAKTSQQHVTYETVA